MKIFIDGHFNWKITVVNDSQPILFHILFYLAVKELLMRSVISYRGLDLKFKRTNPVIDSKSFVLKSTIDAKKGPITIEKFFDYINILINRNPYKLTDLSTQLEQILLIECNNIISISCFSCIRSI